MDRVYHQFVRPVLEEILLAPKDRSSLNDRVEAIFKCSFSMREAEFPKTALAEWKNIQNSRRHAPNTQMASQYENRQVDKPRAVALSLTRNECKAIISSFLKISDEVTKRKGAKEARGIHD